jgi:hypothetical protein
MEVQGEMKNVTGERVKTFHDQHEQNGYHHACKRDSTHHNGCRCTCLHTVDEFDPRHISSAEDRLTMTQMLCDKMGPHMQFVHPCNQTQDQ